MTFRERVASNRRMQHRKLMIYTKKAAICAALIGVTLITVGVGNMDGTDGQRVETTYTIKPGDTLRDISESYLTKNTAGRRYILEFEESIVAENPWIKGHEAEIQPGDKIKITYYTKGGE